MIHSRHVGLCCVAVLCWCRVWLVLITATLKKGACHRRFSPWRCIGTERERGGSLTGVEAKHRRRFEFLPQTSWLGNSPTRRVDVACACEREESVTKRKQCASERSRVPAGSISRLGNSPTHRVDVTCACDVALDAIDASSRSLPVSFTMNMCQVS